MKRCYLREPATQICKGQVSQADGTESSEALKQGHAQHIQGTAKKQEWNKQEE